MAQQQMTFGAMLEKQQPAIAMVIGGSTPAERKARAERFARICLTAIRHTKNLSKCSVESVAAAMMIAAQLNLEPNTPQGLAYLIPYKIKNSYEAQFQIGYRGLLQLAYRSGLIASINADVVYRSEVESGLFSYHRGACPTIRHDTDILRPELRTGEIVAAYAACTLKGGETLLRVIDAGDIERAKKKSASWKAVEDYDSKSSPWLTNEDAMWMKTALRRLAAWMPQTEAIGMALEQDRLGDSTEVVDTHAGVDALNSVLASPAIASVQADDAQTINVTPEPEPQPAAMAEPDQEPMEQDVQTAADKEAEKRRKDEELETLRAETEQLCRDVGMNDRDFWDAVGRTRSNWTTSDCKRLRKRAEARQKQMAQSAAAPGAGESMVQEESLPPVESVPCPRTGERVAETVCNACNQRSGCPEWEA